MFSIFNLLTLGLPLLAKIVAPAVNKATAGVAGSRTVAVAGGIVTTGLALTLLTIVGGYDWTLLLGPTYGGLAITLIGFVVAILRYITTTPAK